MKELEELTNALPAGFEYSAASLCYNPLELFINISQKENTHSKIIADLLNPNGEHQLGYCFLLNYLDKIGLNVNSESSPDSEAPIKVEEIKTEFNAPTKDKAGRIDIFVRFSINEEKYALIIENKLNDAPDQPEQLTRYNSYVKAQYRNYKRITVYMPRIGEQCLEYENAKVLNSTMLADIIDKALSQSNSIHKPTIKAYSIYLRNIGKINTIMNNAKLLANMSTDYIQKAKAIKDAYEKLPEAFSEKLMNIYKGKIGYESKICWKYPNYCYIWNESAYRETRLWLAVGFDNGNYYIYILSDNDNIDKCKDLVNQLEISESSNDVVGHWFKSLKPQDYTGSFCGWDDYKILKPIIDGWLDKLNKAAKIDYNEDSSSI